MMHTVVLASGRPVSFCFSLFPTAPSFLRPRLNEDPPIFFYFQLIVLFFSWIKFLRLECACVFVSLCDVCVCFTFLVTSKTPSAEADSFEHYNHAETSREQKVRLCSTAVLGSNLVNIIINIIIIVSQNPSDRLDFDTNLHALHSQEMAKVLKVGEERRIECEMMR